MRRQSSMTVRSTGRVRSSRLRTFLVVVSTSSTVRSIGDTGTPDICRTETGRFMNSAQQSGGLAAEERSRPCSGFLAIDHGDLTVDDHTRVALGALHAPPLASRQVVD